MSEGSSNSDSTGVNYIDHFSVRKPSSTVKYRGVNVHVYESSTEQFILEDRGYDENIPYGGGNTEEDALNNKQQHRDLARRGITVKRLDSINFGVRFLRLCYTLVAILLVGFLFVLCFQVLLFVFLNLAVDAGFSQVMESANRPDFPGNLASLPVFLYSMASVMSMGSAFVADCWDGGTLIKTNAIISDVTSDIIYSTFFLVIPSLAFITASLAGSVDPWKWCNYVWISCVALVYFAFAAAVFLREMQACFQLVSLHLMQEEDLEGVSKHKTNPFRLALRAVQITQKERFSALRKERYLVSGDEKEPKEGYLLSPNYTPDKVRFSLWSHITQLGCCNVFFKTLDPPKRLYSMDEVRDLMPFETSYTWNLEAMCCRSRDSRVISAVKGPSALKSYQMKLSMVCAIFEVIIVSLILLGGLVWYRAGTILYAVAAVFCALFFLLPTMMRSLAMYRLYKDINEDRSDDDDDDNDNYDDEDVRGSNSSSNINRRTATMFQHWETNRVTQPKAWLCFLVVFLEIVLFFLWPMATLFHSGNYPINVVFLIVGLFSLCRKYFDPCAALSELGSMSKYDVERRCDDSDEARCRSLRVKYRLSEIAGKIGRGGAIGRWMFVFSVFGVAICFLSVAANSQLDEFTPSSRKPRPPIVLVDDFHYPPYPNSLAYPTCEMTKGFRIPGVGNAALGDYAMFSALAYERPNVTEYILAKWFGPGEVIDEHVFVEHYRKESGTDAHPMFFKFFTFSRLPGYGIVALRGSETLWDWCVNMQLWSAPGLAQIVKWLVPIGWIWDGVLDDLVKVANFLEPQKLKDLKYYKVSAGFINMLKAGYGGSRYHGLHVTGASLGGGLAMITGAQTNATAVAISGIGPILSRHTLDPPVTMDQINNLVFNFIPDRDYIARIGGRVRQNQAAECIAPPNNLFACHSMWRSVCEISYRCGSVGRPIPCRCVTTFGYPEPIQNGNRTFAEACEQEEALFIAATGIEALQK